MASSFGPSIQVATLGSQHGCRRQYTHSPRWRHQRGFTLIELLIVVAIIGILASILIPNFLRSRIQAQVSASKGNLKNIATALETYYVDRRAYPDDVTLSVLVTGTYIRAIPNDPCTGLAYVYTPSGGPPATIYTLTTPSWSGVLCGIIANSLSYTPDGGLVQQ